MSKHVEWNESALIANFRDGLRYAIQRQMIMMPRLTTLEVVFVQAAECEELVQQFIPPRQYSDRFPDRPATIQPRQAIKCFNCQKDGHLARNCRSTKIRLQTSICTDPQDETLNPKDEYLLSLSKASTTMITGKASIVVGGRSIGPIQFLVDSGASVCFIRKGLLPTDYLQHSKPHPANGIELANGKRLNASEVGGTSQIVKVLVATVSSMQQLVEIENLSFPLVLGMTWLSEVNPKIDWSRQLLIWNEKPNNNQLCTLTAKTVSLPREYEDLACVCEQVELRDLPRRGRYDCAIELRKDAALPRAKLYSLSAEELNLLQK